MLPIRTILHPTDFSRQSASAFQVARSLARDHNSRLVILYVRAPAVVGYGELGAVVPDPIQTPNDVKERLIAEHMIESRLDVECRVAEGDPAVEIVRTANDLGAGMVVMGTHGRSGFSRLLLGSVAEVVLRKAACPVLTVKAPFPAAVAESAPAAEEPVAI
jgi:nucleotide-binding universal stress UspA family protein